MKLQRSHFSWDVKSLALLAEYTIFAALQTWKLRSTYDKQLFWLVIQYVANLDYAV
jgi:hypothetical protein